MKSLRPSPLSKTASLVQLSLLAAFAASSAVLHAAPIPIPNGSFESQSGVGQPFGVNINMDDWQKQDWQSSFSPAPNQPNGLGYYWVQTAGNFLNPSTPPGIILNPSGTQAAYILSYAGAGIFQDYTSTDWAGSTHTFNATYQVGQSYELTAGVFGESVNDGAQLQFSLYYRDGSNNMVTVGTPKTITYHASDFQYADLSGDYNLIDFKADVPVVQPGDAWAGQNIGINIEVLSGDGTNQWALDNVRLTSAPEPGSLALLAMGFSGLLLRRRQRSQSGV